MGLFPATLISYARKRKCPVAGRTRQDCDKQCLTRGRIAMYEANCANMRNYFRVTWYWPVSPLGVHGDVALSPSHAPALTASLLPQYSSGLVTDPCARMCLTEVA